MAQYPVVRRDDRRRLRLAREDRLEQIEQLSHRRIDGDASSGELDCRCENGVEGKAAEPAMHVQVARETAGYGDRAESRVEHLVGGGEVHVDGQEVQLPFARGQTESWRVDEEVEEDVFMIRGVGEQEAAAAQTREADFGHRAGEPGGDAGVERVAPGPQYRSSRVGHCLVSARDQPSRHRQILSPRRTSPARS